jgi:hypothetical protein
VVLADVNEIMDVRTLKTRGIPWLDKELLASQFHDLNLTFGGCNVRVPHIKDFF